MPRVRAEFLEQGHPASRKRVATLMQLRWPAWNQPSPGIRRHNEAGPAAAACAGPGQSPVRGERPGRALGRRYDLCADLSRLHLPGRGAGRLEPPGHRLVDRSIHDGRSRPDRAEHGSVAATTGGRHPSQRSGQPIHQHYVRYTLSADGVRPSMGSVGDAYDNAMAPLMRREALREVIEPEHRSACREAGLQPAAVPDALRSPHQIADMRPMAGSPSL